MGIPDILWASCISPKGRAVSSLGSCQAFHGVCLGARTLSEIVKHLLWNPVEESYHRATAGRRKRSYLFLFCPLMCLLITALMKYLQLIMIWSNWNPFRKDKWNCYYWWMLCDSGEIGMAMWASDGSYYIGWITSVIAAFWFVMPESCLIRLCKELDLSAVTAQILLVVHPLLNLVSILSNSPLGIPCLSMAGWVQAECLGCAGSASVLSCALCSALSLVCTEIALLRPRLFGIFTSQTWPRACIDLNYQHKHLPKGSSHLPWLPQPVFLFRNNQGHMILIQRRICSISLLWFRHLGGKEKKECDPWRRYPWRCVQLEFG